MQSRAAFMLLAALAAACSKTPEPEPSTPPATGATASPKGASPATSAASPAPAKQGGSELAWDVPAGWETAANPSPMRKATYKIKKADGDPEDGEMSVSQAGGTVDMNVKRWAGQFEQKPGEGAANADSRPTSAEAKQTQRTVGDLKVTVVEVRGTFTGSGMPGMPAAGPKPGWALLGAIVEPANAAGGAPWFFKLTGPEKTISSARGDFDKLVDSLRPK